MSSFTVELLIHMAGLAALAGATTATPVLPNVPTTSSAYGACNIRKWREIF